jgi:adenylate cyclase
MEPTAKDILIVEDDHALQSIYSQKLTSEGFAVRQAFTGNQGLTLSKEKTPDLILLDVMLPAGMNGFDLLERIKVDPVLAAVPVIVFTNLDSEQSVAKTMGAVDYLVKANTSIDELVSKVKMYIK